MLRVEVVYLHPVHPVLHQVRPGAVVHGSVVTHSRCRQESVTRDGTQLGAGCLLPVFPELVLRVNAVHQVTGLLDGLLYGLK